MPAAVLQLKPKAPPQAPHFPKTKKEWMEDKVADAKEVESNRRNEDELKNLLETPTHCQKLHAKEVESNRRNEDEFNNLVETPTHSEKEHAKEVESNLPCPPAEKCGPRGGCPPRGGVIIT